MRLVGIELEATRNDITMAIEDPRAFLGYDLLTLRTRGVHRDPQASKLAHAMGELESPRGRSACGTSRPHRKPSPSMRARSTDSAEAQPSTAWLSHRETSLTRFFRGRLR